MHSPKPDLLISVIRLGSTLLGRTRTLPLEICSACYVLSSSTAFPPNQPYDLDKSIYLGISQGFVFYLHHYMWRIKCVCIYNFNSKDFIQFSPLVSEFFFFKACIK